MTMSHTVLQLTEDERSAEHAHDPTGAALSSRSVSPTPVPSHLSEPVSDAEGEKAEGGEPAIEVDLGKGMRAAEMDMLDWDSPTDLDDLRNWSTFTRRNSAGVTSYYTFIAPLASGLPMLAADYRVERPTLEGLSLSIYVLAFVVGRLFLAPLSEMYGHRWVQHGANLFFLVFLLACASTPSMASFIVFCFFAGLGGIASLAIGSGVIADLFHQRERASAMTLYTLGPVLGPVLGLVAGGFVVQIIVSSYPCSRRTLLMVVGSQYGFLYLMCMYGISAGMSGLAYLGLGIGFLTCTGVAAGLMDQIYAKQSEKNGGVGVREFHLPIVWIGAFFGPTGLWHAHWMLSIISSGLFCCGMMSAPFPIQVDIIDTFQYAASALAAATI
ncbi:MFS general substrate transporter [Calocera viscosa TUFC12733]|uniref:MFS general substrate transporter n=1 Tax=Calocera viscosa (strain TUFC12733) TaxID=1330018 RepID=A0A167GTE4_CALVF|nr:MFS general substrate transporter [Calocera viscosa TUFC12733]